MAGMNPFENPIRLDPSENLAMDEHQFIPGVPYPHYSRLNTIDICIPSVQRRSEAQRGPLKGRELWIIYIHGGAWRDPEITSRSFEAAQSLLLLNPDMPIAGLASLNYRLSPYPSHPTNPSSIGDLARNARYPDHVSDVFRAIKFLQGQYAFGEQYILCGHSCGATIGLQFLAHYISPPINEIPYLGLGPEVYTIKKPLAFCGVEGIYSICDLVDRNPHPAYREFVTAAFGMKGWTRCSPVNAALDGWDGLFVLAHSKGDELVEWKQVEDMGQTLKRYSYRCVNWELGMKQPVEGPLVQDPNRLFINHGGRKEVLLLELMGKHDEVWQCGGELARAIEVTLKRVLT